MFPVLGNRESWVLASTNTLPGHIDGNSVDRSHESECKRHRTLFSSGLPRQLAYLDHFPEAQGACCNLHEPLLLKANNYSQIPNGNTCFNVSDYFPDHNVCECNQDLPYKLTLPPTDVEVNYVSSPKIRGTLTIVWSCLFTIIACTWTVQHLSLPWQKKHYPRDNDLKGRKVNGWNWKIPPWKVSKWKHSTAWFLATILAPEIPLGKHLGDLWHALKLRQQFEEKFKPNIDVRGKIEWKDKHWLFAIMGGFTMRTKVSPDKITHVGDSFPPSEIKSSARPEPLRAEGIESVLETAISGEVIARAVQDLAVSQLEIATVAFTLCAVIIYALAWNKPQGVNVPITIYQVSDRGNGLGAILEKERTPTSASRAKQSWGELRKKRAKAFGTGFEDYFKTEDGENYDGPWILAAASLTGTLFGGVHLAAWNCHFPTSTEKLLWRIAALHTTAFPLGLLLLIFIIAEMTDETTKKPEPGSTTNAAGNLPQKRHHIREGIATIIVVLSIILLLLGFIVYFPARLYLLLPFHFFTCELRSPSITITAYSQLHHPNPGSESSPGAPLTRLTARRDTRQNGRDCWKLSPAAITRAPTGTLLHWVAEAFDRSGGAEELALFGRVLELIEREQWPVGLPLDLFYF
ncbi:uncharacterized protein BO97DRAFT_447816 [Aspergillus homomorphus CBS 101889]|uniref:Uncharacterized protein n=1 Tax=Aspergillus homomorphus (strain CBS 101889) TaxID=1450537 RepID=A0A395IE37_ASPHC|nr:hypothetical protein BO97DRAFT_447816 [Aspergillus homomorphus CBS 101889]RAL17423.1 hypothetical protein BO97DRAFT_447816 [Aspergillus homomorphus CBS 101889]